MSENFLPYGRQSITEADKKAVLDVLESDFLTTGPKVAEFEKIFAEYVRAPHAICMSSATAALHLAALALDIGEGDCVLAPTMSFAASANGAAYTGARIEFMDCDPESGLVTPQLFAEAADRAEASGNPAKMAVIVHLNGEHADMAGIAEEACKRNIRLVEDACHALGTTFVDRQGEGHMVGACRYSVMSTFSFHPVKTLTTGEGGIVTCRDEALANRIKDLRSHGIVRDKDRMLHIDMAHDQSGDLNPWYYEMQTLGYNYRLTDIACALGVSQMERMPDFAERRREMKRLYDDLFAESNLPVRTINSDEGVDSVRHLYPLLIDFEAIGMSRAEFMQKLRDSGIGTQVHYIPIHAQPYYKELNPELQLNGASDYYEKVISIPFYPDLTDDDIKRVVNSIAEVMR